MGLAVASIVLCAAFVIGIFQRVIAFGQTLSVMHRCGIALALVITGLLLMLSALRLVMAGRGPEEIALLLGLVIAVEGLAGAFMLSAVLPPPRSRSKSGD